MRPEDIIIKPIITEKSNDGLQDGKYTFKVNKKATKVDIARAVEKLFDVKVINIDLDNDGVNEKIVSFFDTKSIDTRIIMFDGEDDVIANLVNVKGKQYKLDDVVEFWDIDGDNVIEIITKLPDSNEVTVSKYYVGYYFPKVEYN